MPQKISAFYYIKNNKRRVAVLAVSLAMFFIANYLVAFLLSTTEETFRKILTEAPEYVQYIELNENDLKMDFSNSSKSLVQVYTEAVSEKCKQIVPRLKECEGVEDVFSVALVYSHVSSVVGEYSVEVPMVTKERMEKMLEKMDAVLIDGRLPENENEAVLDLKLMKNNGYEIGDNLSQNSEVVIVGVIDCNYYFGCGLANEMRTYTRTAVCVLTDGSIKDLRAVAKGQGVVLKNSNFVDVEEGEKELKEEVLDVISSSTGLLSGGFMAVIFVLVIIVDISYLRDRRSEWCLYASIGYGRRTIYFSILREVLFTFGIAVFAAIVICAGLMFLLDGFAVSARGLLCRYFLGDTAIEILCAYLALFGLLQIPIRIEIYRIKTIDAIDDDM